MRAPTSNCRARGVAVVLALGAAISLTMLTGGLVPAFAQPNCTLLVACEPEPPPAPAPAPGPGTADGPAPSPGLLPGPIIIDGLPAETPGTTTTNPTTTTTTPATTTT